MDQVSSKLYNSTLGFSKTFPVRPHKLLNLIISFSSPPASLFFLPHQGFFAPLVAKGGQLAPFIVGTLLEAV